MNELGSIRQRLWDEDENVRNLAAQDAGYDDLVEAIEPLCERLDVERVPALRHTLMMALQRMTHAEVIEPALSMLSNEDVFVRNSAVALLQAKGQSALRGLERMLDNPDADIRKLVLDTVSAIGGCDAERLLARGLADSDINVQISAVEYLGERGSANCTPLIESMFENARDPMLLAATATALSLAGGEGSWNLLARRFPTYEAVPPYLLGSWLSLLACSGDRSLEELLKIAVQLPQALAGDGVDALVTLQERLNVDIVDSSAFEHLRALIASTTNTTIRFRLLRWSGSLCRHPEVVSLLAAYLDMKDTPCRHGAVLGLLRTGRREALEVLKRHVANEMDAEVRDSIETGLAFHERPL